MIKLIIFDLDGVLVEAKEIHYQTLNQAIAQVAGKEFIINENEHLSTYDGLKTKQKLNMLSIRKGLPVNTHQKIWNLKQELTIQELNKIKTAFSKVELFHDLRQRGLKLACCSNSIRRSVIVMLSKLGLIEYMDLIISNEDVQNSKPHPEMYWMAMSKLNVLPEETLIVEDSPPGLLAAGRSSANVMRVRNPKDLTKERLYEVLNKKGMNIIKPKWEDNKLNIVIPMAGAGSRFEQAGYTFPKPLIDVNGKPMIQVVVDNLNIDANYIFIVQKSHREKYNLDTLLKLITPSCTIVEVDGLTEGAACTTLLAKEFINNDQPLLMANSDQYVEWDSSEFMYKVNEQQVDASMVTFTATHPKWSFARVDEDGYVVEVAEKNPISDIATVGIYYWAKGSDYVSSAEEMIEKNIRVNNEFYVCPVFNVAIENGLKVRTYHIDKMWGLGTPADLEYYLRKFNEHE